MCCNASHYQVHSEEKLCVIICKPVLQMGLNVVYVLHSCIVSGRLFQIWLPLTECTDWVGVVRLRPQLLFLFCLMSRAVGREKKQTVVVSCYNRQTISSNVGKPLKAVTWFLSLSIAILWELSGFKFISKDKKNARICTTVLQKKPPNHWWEKQNTPRTPHL